MLTAQKAVFPRLHKPGRYADDTTFVTLQLAKGRSVPVHLDINDVHCVLREGVTHRDDGGKVVVIGSPRERELLGVLQTCLDRSFGKERQAAIVASSRFNHDRKVMTWDEYLRGQLLRSMHRYKRRTGAKIDSILIGKGTVRLSLKITLPGGKPELFTFRELDGPSSLRLYRGDATTALLIGSGVETQVTLGAVSFLKQLPTRDAKAKALEATLAAYRRATAPRSLRVSFLLDGGSVQIALVDAENRSVQVRFDHQLQTKTPGRLKVEWGDLSGLIEVGSKAETKVLTLLDRAVAIARLSEGGKTKAERLAEKLADYRASFHDK